jgi:hypothetical protein
MCWMRPTAGAQRSHNSSPHDPADHRKQQVSERRPILKALARLSRQELHCGHVPRARWSSQWQRGRALVVLQNGPFKGPAETHILNSGERRLEKTASRMIDPGWSMGSDYDEFVIKDAKEFCHDYASPLIYLYLAVFPSKSENLYRGPLFCHCKRNSSISLELLSLLVVSQCKQYPVHLQSTYSCWWPE